MSQGAYGWKVGMPRILDLLARYGLRVTFFVPGLVMEQRPAHGRGDPEGAATRSRITRGRTPGSST